MKLGRTILFVAGCAAALAFSAAPALAADDALHPVHPDHPEHEGSCWSISKVAKDAAGNPLTELTLSVGQSYTITYEITVTKRACAAGETPHESVDVKDSTLAEPLAIHLHDSATFTYTREIRYGVCGEFDVENTAEVWNSHVLTTSSAAVHVSVPCDAGCTLTQGYWKTHSELGPAPYDNTWAQLPNGASTTFFSSGKSWYQVFWTPPAGGNVYYQLAHQYMAAVLNRLNGASSTAAVDAALASAVTFFNAYTPATAGALGKTSAARKNALALAGTLASYNEGDIGPGHCDE